jgi:drug/metabolite transporter (DMT)-like permease
MTALLWGVTSIIYSQLLKVFSPVFLFTLHGTIFSWIGTVFYLKYRDGLHHEAKNIKWVFFAIMTITVVIITQFFFYKALEKNPESHKAIAIAYTAPMFSLLFLWFLQLEKITPVSILGVLLTVSGITFMTFKK